MTLEQMKAALLQALTWLKTKNTIPPAPPPPTMPSPHQPLLIDVFCHAISLYEGKPGDLNHVNNNPGNLRHWYTANGTNHGFAVFDTWAHGYAALRQLVSLAAQGVYHPYYPSMSILQFFQLYAPSSDANNPAAYATFVAKQCSVPVETEISALLA